MKKTYMGIRDEDDGEIRVLVYTNDGTRETEKELGIEKSLRLWRHSPTGFEFGYNGSGPAQLALAILLEHGLGDDEAVAAHQTFKFKVIGNLPRKGFKLTSDEISAALAKIGAPR